MYELVGTNQISVPYDLAPKPWVAVEGTIILSKVRVRELGRAQQWPLASRQMRSTDAESAGILLRKHVADPTPWPSDGHTPWLSVVPKPSSVGEVRPESQTRESDH